MRRIAIFGWRGGPAPFTADHAAAIVARFRPRLAVIATTFAWEVRPGLLPRHASPPRRVVLALVLRAEIAAGAHRRFDDLVREIERALLARCLRSV